jgi:photosystem II stability/assembly factor-like uncharacterized protein
MRHRYLSICILLCSITASLDVALWRTTSSISTNNSPQEIERDGYAADAAAFRARSLKDNHGRIPPQALLRAHQHVRAMKAEAARKRGRGRIGGDLQSTAVPDTGGSAVQAGAASGDVAWKWMGPGNIGGRVRSVVIHPVNHDVMFAGSVSGGLWKTTNGGAWWEPVDDFMANLAISSIVFDPRDPSIMYAGTGEGFFNSDGLRGAGIFKSTDGGVTWNHLPATGTYHFDYVNRLAISPDGRVLLAGTQTGVARSTDGGATFTTNTSISWVLDVDFHPSDNSLAVASGIGGTGWFSRDGGISWTAASGLPDKPGSITRVEIAYAPATPDVVYASVNINQGELYRSVDGGATYTRAGTISGYLSVQGDYDHVLWVNPRDSNDLIIAGVWIYRTRDGGVSMNTIFTDQTHVDFHHVAAHPLFDNVNNTTLFVANDGGVYKLPTLPRWAEEAPWQSLNNNLGITQFYGAAGSARTGKIVGGTQDNRTLVFTPAHGPQAWFKTLFSDGGFAAVDPDDGETFYAEVPRLRIYRYDWRGSMEITVGLPDAGVRANFVAPFILDPNKPTRMLAGGRSLWRSEDVKNEFHPVWTDIKTNDLNINAIAIADGNPDVIWMGDGDGKVFKTTTGTAAAPQWTQVNTGLPARWITRISIDPSNHDVVYVSYGWFRPDNIYKTTDGGATWREATGSGLTGLPDAPVRDVEIDPLNPSSIWAATEVGIFHSMDGGATWELPHDGPANVSVDELFTMGRTLGAATHGRGVFLADLSSAPLIGITPSALAFGERTVGTLSAAQRVTLVNTGNAPLTVSAAAFEGTHAADFNNTADTCSGASLPPGAQCALDVAFRPPAAGSRSAILSIASNAPGSPHSVTLAGSGVDRASDGAQRVSWTNIVRVAPDAIGISKSAGCNMCPDAGALSEQAVTGEGGYIEFYAIAGSRFYAGLSADRSSSTDPAAIDFAFSIWPSNTWEIRERGVYRTDGYFQQGDVFRIAVEDGNIRYSVNGSVVYSYRSSVAPVFPLRFDVTMFSLNARLENAMIRAAAAPPPPPSGDEVVWINTANVTVTGSSIVKTAGCNGCGDAGGISEQQITGDGYAEFTPVYGHRLYAGLGADRSAGTTPELVDYAFSFWPDGGFDIREKGVYRGEGVFDADDVFRVAVEGGVVRYYQNGGLLYTSTVAPVFPMGLDTTLFYLDSGIASARVHSTASASITWTNTVNVDVAGATVFKTAGCDGCSDAGATSAEIIGDAGGAVSFTDPLGRLMAGLSTDRSASTTNAIPYSFRFSPDNTWDVRENGIYRTEGPTTPGDVFRIVAKDGVVRYYHNDALVHTSGAPPPSGLGVDVTLYSAGAAITAAIAK